MSSDRESRGDTNDGDDDETDPKSDEIDGDVDDDDTGDENDDGEVDIDIDGKEIRPRCYTFFMLNSTEHAHKCISMVFTISESLKSRK